MIGIGLINHGRNEIFYECLRNVEKFAPESAKLSIIDDASPTPIKGATIRHDTQKGIAASKNANLRELSDCDHIFLLDSDTWPKREKCWERYINAGYNHMCLTWQKDIRGRGDARIKARINGAIAYTHANGCMLYLNNSVVKGIEFDESYGLWGFEHIAFSTAIYKAGFTPHPFIDLPDSLTLFHPLDYYGEVESSVPEHIRVAHAKRNRIKYDKLCKG